MELSDPQDIIDMERNKFRRMGLNEGHRLVGGDNEAVLYFILFIYGALPISQVLVKYFINM